MLLGVVMGIVLGLWWCCAGVVWGCYGVVRVLLWCCWCGCGCVGVGGVDGVGCDGVVLGL